MSNARNLSKLSVDSNGDVAVGSLPAAINVNASAPADSLAINASGQIGVGTTTTNGQVNIAKSGGNQLSLIDSSGSSPGIRFANSSNTALGFIEAPAGNGLAFFSGSTERMRIDSSGNLLVGTTTSFDGGIYKLEIGHGSNRGILTNSTGTSLQYAMIFQNGNGTVGNINTNGSSTAFATSSDYRLKENIQPMQNALGVVQQLNPVTYTWKVDGSAGQGFIAHELQAVVPDCVTGEKDAVETYTDADGVEKTRPLYQGVDTSFLVATLTKAIQEQQAIIESLTARIEALEAA